MKNLLGRNSYDWVAIGIVTIGAFIVFNLLGCREAHAEAIPEAEAVHAILGEAPPGADYEVLSAFAHALRNRGHLRGVYGKAVNPSAKRLKQSKRAWVNSLVTPDPTKGASFWLSDWDLKHCRPALIAWRFSMVETLNTGQTHFYRLSVPR